MAKTIVIWNQFAEGLNFFVTDEDLSHWEGCYVNEVGMSDELLDEMIDFVYESEGGYKVKTFDTFPHHEIEPGTRVVLSGFYP